MNIILSIIYWELPDRQEKIERWREQLYCCFEKLCDLFGYRVLRIPQNKDN